MHKELLKPFGIVLYVNTKCSIQSVVAIDELKALVKEHHLVVLRGFTPPSKEELVDYAKSMGDLLRWEFGQVMEMRVHEEPKNYLFTHGPVPFHWDGAFHQVPRYLLFHCIQAPFQDCGGESIFSNTSEIWNHANKEDKEKWSFLQITAKTEKVAHYGGCITFPILQHHVDTNKSIMRFCEPVSPQELNPVEVYVEGFSNEESESFISDLSKRCYQPEYCYAHIWEENDFLIADNYTLLHGRYAFKKYSPRHLRRIQVM